MVGVAHTVCQPAPGLRDPVWGPQTFIDAETTSFWLCSGWDERVQGRPCPGAWVTRQMGAFSGTEMLVTGIVKRVGGGGVGGQGRRVSWGQLGGGTPGGDRSPGEAEWALVLDASCPTDRMLTRFEEWCRLECGVHHTGRPGELGVGDLP